uniref:Ion_trans_2 domain-containing protein n=1 Tax=Globodera pallida TaxID=36090 RepID=A0A183BX24_GLOPA
MQQIESNQVQNHKLNPPQPQQQHSMGKRMVAMQKLDVQKHPLRHVRRINHQNDCLGPIIKALPHSHCNDSALRQLDHCYRFLTEHQVPREEPRHLEEKPPIRGWSFTDSVLFCFTVITTIGYGNVAPKTFPGQMFCILYALIGIPFTLLAIADLGKFLSEILEGWERTCRSAKKEAPPFEPPKEEELNYADDEAIIEWEPQKTPSTSTEHEEQQPSEPEPEEPKPEPEPEPPEPEPEPDPEPEPPEPEPEEPEVEELAIDLTDMDEQSLQAPTVEQSTPSERRKSNYSDEAWRRYLEYQKQWKKFRHTQTSGASSIVDIAHTTPKSPSTSSPRAKSAMDNSSSKASTSARGAQKLSLAALREQSAIPLRQKKTSRTSTASASSGQKKSTNRGAPK